MPPPSSALWKTRARISLSGARAAYLGPGLDLAPHRNAAATVAIALDSAFTLSLAASSSQLGTGIERAAALIPPNALHHLRATGPMLFLYLDALCDDVKALNDVALQNARPTLLREDLSTAGVDRILSTLGIAPRPPDDDRLAQVIRQLDARPQDFANVADAAALAELSPSWFQARFRRAVGMPFRRYRLWRRMAVVMAALGEGRTLTEAAHGAGFASSSHLSATFREMFGLAPSDLLVRQVSIDAIGLQGL
ncbi:helix-turn-helix transcriptional regulator [Achromobacter sp. GG226]|uniref:AraC family transcriptional regulator n=1 Tax=Verticiella alkaliphila TaxID=2779529 RepID=UPI001C0D4DF6|nr:AraC family transcriptional regulator [Verticiella sp. GG226]MBU4611777.1 helix-turn-helix transcriptional regulator [Verticiella sp. GG226]